MPFRCALPLLVLWTAIVLSNPTPHISSRQSNNDNNNPAIAEPYLHQLAQANGKLWFGTATNVYQSHDGEESNEAYMTILNNSDIFGQLTPVNQMKFATTEPKQGIFNYTVGDMFVSLARSTNKPYIRCHNLIWGSSLPDWLTQGTWTNATLTAVMQTHILNVVSHFGTACYSWDVINEALAADGTFAPNIWYDTIGPEYVFLAFKFAADAVAALTTDISSSSSTSSSGDNSRSVKLYYNDYGIEYPSPKPAATASLVRALQSRGLRIDGVAFESHFTINSLPDTTSQIAAMTSLTALNIDVVISELDVRFPSSPELEPPPNQNSAASAGPPPTTYSAADLAIQAQNYHDSVAACTAVARCVGVTVWDFADAYSWVVAAYNGTEGGADLYDGELVRKPAYGAVAGALGGAA